MNGQCIICRASFIHNSLVQNNIVHRKLQKGIRTHSLTNSLTATTSTYHNTIIVILSFPVDGWIRYRRRNNRDDLRLTLFFIAISVSTYSRGHCEYD